MMIVNMKKSLRDLLGDSYIESVCKASAALGLGTIEELMKIGSKEIEFYPDSFRAQQCELLKCAGKSVIDSFNQSIPGAGTKAFQKALDRASAPLSGSGCYRLGEDGKLHIIGKSEHYQASLGHNFPGFKLLQNAMKIGITNITHNNTRGYVTRLLEQQLVRIANGLKIEETAALEKVLKSEEKHVLNRVINLETGSLACEAALKMMLARFYRLQESFPLPKYSGKVPVILVMAAFDGSKEANYHGTTVITQLMRGMWPDLYLGMEKADLLKVVPVPINDASAFSKIVAEYDTGKYKIAGFFHELVLMNYGGVRLTKEYVKETHALCHEHDVPIMVDEIQSCMWSPELFLFKEYECHPDFVSVGKGFPAGMYPASKVLTTFPMDNLNQFGALVTNGQEELASLANLITIAFAEHNAEHTEEISALWEKELHILADDFSGLIEKAEGHGLLGTLFFKNPENAVEFSHMMGHKFSIDISAQTYKAHCPPAALTKLPLISEKELIDHVSGCMRIVLTEMKDKVVPS